VASVPASRLTVRLPRFARKPVRPQPPPLVSKRRSSKSWSWRARYCCLANRKAPPYEGFGNGGDGNFRKHTVSFKTCGMEF